MTKVASSSWGNPSSIHSYGARARSRVETARIQVGGLMGSSPNNIIFTSGGTEANNIAILSLDLIHPGGGHVITSPIEHKAVSQSVARLKATGRWNVCHLPVNRQGFVDPEGIYRLARKDTKLISVIYGQSEIGSLQAVKRIGAIARELGIPFHTDAVQVFGKLPINAREIGCDFMSVSSHKIQGPQGAGALYVSDEAVLAPIGAGGSHEFGLRPGTVPAPLLAGFGEAARLAAERMADREIHVNRLRDELLKGMLSMGLLLTGSEEMAHRIPGHLSFMLPPRTILSGKEMVQLLSKQGVMASPGSACNCPYAPSEILKSLGYSDKEATKGLRMSLGPENVDADIDKAMSAMALSLSLSGVDFKNNSRSLTPEAV